MYKRVHPVRLAGFLAIAGFAAAAHFGRPFHVLLVVVALFPVMFAVSVVQPGGATPPARWSLTVFGTVCIGPSVAHPIILRELPPGADIIIDILIGTFIGDSGAYLGGRSFGRRRLAPAVSPSK